MVIVRQLARGAILRVGHAAVAVAVHEGDPVCHAAGAEQRAEARHPEEVDPEVQSLLDTYSTHVRNLALGRQGVQVEGAHVVKDEPRERRQVQVAHQCEQLCGRGARGGARLEHVLQLREHRVRSPCGHCAHARDQNGDGRRDLLQHMYEYL